MRNGPLCRSAQWDIILSIDKFTLKKLIRQSAAVEVMQIATLLITRNRKSKREQEHAQETQSP